MSTSVVFVATIALIASWCSTLLAQSAGAAIGALAGGLFDDGTKAVALRAMKAPSASVGMGPKRLEFSDVSVNEPVRNVLSITNGTNSRVEIESVSLRSAGFYLPPSLSLPLTIPAQTEALLTVGFLPGHPGKYGGAVEVAYRISSDGSLHKMRIALKGKGVLK
jgi:hypothetical protein